MSKFSKMLKVAQQVVDAQGSSRQQGSGPSRSGASSGSSLRSTIENAVASFGGGSRPQGPATPPTQRAYPASTGGHAQQSAPSQVSDADRRAIARYDYLMQTADPHQVEQIHADAFARLTPAQREAVRDRMQTDLPPHEQPRSADVADLSRAAARTEARRPGSMRSVLAKVGAGGAAAGVAVGAVGVLGVVAAGAAVSSVAGPLLAEAANLGVDLDALAAGVDVEGLVAGASDLGVDALGDVGAGLDGVTTAAEGTLGGLGDTFSEAGGSLSDLARGLDPRDLF
ncbi:hypothetical protein [Isoptericola dokdonensis]|uniref:Cation-transporting ATPase n=1 Tax=Isoptericola dokdonensis DS-3 TaxID=1300344 RepID=A0A161IMS7_9MICO|nr:hypothetical protein [Isoptericola dokdonensis]ANC31930.1 hypothetical protein I598_2390 [Isoptericola dokdonensis DS-3]